MRISDWSSDVCSSDLSDPGFWKAGRDQKSPLRRCFKPLDPPKLWRSPAVPTSKVVGVVGATTGTCEFGHAVNMPIAISLQGKYPTFFAGGLWACSASTMIGSAACRARVCHYV